MALIRQWLSDGKHRQSTEYAVAMQKLFDIIQLQKSLGFTLWTWTAIIRSYFVRLSSDPAHQERGFRPAVSQTLGIPCTRKSQI
jgi:hypothetical protein